MTRNNKLMVIVGSLIVIASIWTGIILLRGRSGNVATSCTQEARLCPGGSAVGRTGPNCEFAPCPTAPPTNEPPVAVEPGWIDHADAATGVSFQYPKDLGTKYIDTVDWPPQVSVAAGPFTCTAGGSEIASAGVTTPQVINGHDYCVTRESEGAAGSTYTLYTYAFSKGNKTVILTFNLRFPQCLNYDNPKQTECLDERQSFDIDGTIDRIAATLRAADVTAAPVGTGIN
jgi:hypothetical protein